MTTKTYFIDVDGIPEGPFDFPTLLTKNLGRQTSIWYEGLAEWTTAKDLEELKHLFVLVPPPIVKPINVTPPPIRKPEPTQDVSSDKRRAFKNRNRWIASIFAAVLILLVAGLIMTNPDAVEGIREALPSGKIEINPPRPTVITHRADNSKSDLFKMRTTFYATVQNQGGDGSILVNFHLHQNGNNYDRTKVVYLNANESTEVEETFLEVKRLTGEITYDVDTRAE